MEFSIKQSALRDAMAAVAGCIDKTRSIPILSSVLLETVGESQLRITATDMDVTIRRDVEADIVAAGAICIEGRKLNDVTRNLSGGDMRFVTEDSSWVRLTSGSSKFRFAGRPRSEFPEEAVNKTPGIAIEVAALKKLIERTAFAIDAGARGRMTLSGAQVEIGDGIARMITTDQNRLPLADVDVSTTETLSVLVPQKALAEIVRIDDETVSIGVDSNHIFFESSSQIIISRRLQGTFPRYEMVLPKDNDLRAGFDVEDMKAAIRRASLMSNDQIRSVQMDFGGGEIVIIAKSTESGEAEERVVADFTGETISIGFQWAYVMDFLNACGDAKRAFFSFKDTARTPVEMGIEGDETYRYVLMPVNLGVTKTA